MKRLEYVIEDRTIAEVLGVQNFTNEESAVLELVKKEKRNWLTDINARTERHGMVFPL